MTPMLPSARLGLLRQQEIERKRLEILALVGEGGRIESRCLYAVGRGNAPNGWYVDVSIGGRLLVELEIAKPDELVALETAKRALVLGAGDPYAG